MAWVERGTGGLPGVRNPDAGWHYRWLADDIDRLRDHLQSGGDGTGYKVVGAGQPIGEVRKIAVRLGFTEAHVDDTTGRIMYGRLILGQIPMAEAKRRQHIKKQDMADRLRHADEEFHEAARGKGVRPFKKEIGEIEERKEFARRDGEGRVAVPSNFEGTGTLPVRP